MESNDFLEWCVGERRRRWEVEYLGRRNERLPPEGWQSKYAEPEERFPSPAVAIPDGWTWASFAQVTERVSVGHVGPTSEFFTTAEDGVPFVRSQDVRPGRLMLTQVKHVVPDFHAQLKKSQLQAGDVLVVRVGANRGDSCVVPDGVGEINCANIVFARPLAASGFFGLFVRSPLGQELLQSISVGSAQGVLNTTVIARLPVPCPPLDEQRRIAAVLGALDDKIELNRKMNRTLEVMAQAIFKSWFIDFDGHDPADMVDSELGPIPRGWKVKALDEIADFLNGAACQKYPAQDGQPSFPVIKIRELNQGIGAETDRATADIPPKWWVKDGDVLFSWSGSLVVKVWTGGPGALNQHLFKVTSAVYPKWFFLLWTKHHLAEFQGVAADKATTMGHIQRHHLTHAKVLVPPRDALDRVGDLLEPLLGRQIASDLESRTLAAVRDALLPKLISGEIRVPEAKALVEEAV